MRTLIAIAALVACSGVTAEPYTYYKRLGTCTTLYNLGGNRVAGDLSVLSWGKGQMEDDKAKAFDAGESYGRASARAGWSYWEKRALSTDQAEIWRLNQILENDCEFLAEESRKWRPPWVPDIPEWGDPVEPHSD